MSELVRQSVDSLFRSQGMPNREELKRRALDTVGRFRSGSRDISTHHDRYLEKAFKN